MAISVWELDNILLLNKELLDLDADGLADGWVKRESVGEDADPTFSIVTAPSGGNAQRVTITANTGYQGVTGYPTIFKPSSGFILTFWARASADCVLETAFTAANIKQLVSTWTHHITTEWREVKRYVHFPISPQNLMHFSVNLASGTFDFGDISFAPIPRSIASQSTTFMVEDIPCAFVKSYVAPDGVLWGYTNVALKLQKSLDGGDTCTEVYDFTGGEDCYQIGGIHVTSNGNIYVSTWGDDYATVQAKSHIWRSEDGGTTFEQVLDLRGDIRNWCFDSDDTYLFVTEYGYSTAPNNCRYLRRTSDWGDTWDIVLDLGTTTTGTHLHGVSIDTFNPGTVWLCVGDVEPSATTGIYRSDSNGDSGTWSRVIGCKSVKVLPRSDAVYFVDDTASLRGVGIIYQIDRATNDVEVICIPDVQIQANVYGMSVDNAGIIYANYCEGFNRLGASPDGGRTWVFSQPLGNDSNSDAPTAESEGYIFFSSKRCAVLTFTGRTAVANRTAVSR